MEEGGGGTLTLVLPFVLVRRLLCPLLAKREDERKTVYSKVQCNNLDGNSNATLAHWHTADSEFKGCARV